MKNGFRRAQGEERTEVSETILLRSKTGITLEGKARSKANETRYRNRKTEEIQLHQREILERIQRTTF
jgi:hypothetical protein